MTVITMSIPNSSNITREVLENGITVLVYENPTVRSVVLTGSFRAGAIYESPDKNGLSSLTASALMRGTHTRDFNTIHSALEDIGADLDYSTGAHRVGFGGKSLAEDLIVLLESLKDTLRYPAFPAAQVERLRGERLTWLQYRLQDTRWLASRDFREALYPANHPYHLSSRGTLESIPTITIDDMRQFHAKHYGPKGMLLVIVGAVKAQEAIDLVRQTLGDWTNAEQPDEPALPHIPARTEAARTFANVAGKTQSDLVIGTLGPSRYAPDYQAANLANSVLGQFGMMGRIGDIVREREGMAYYASSRMEGGFGPGAWSVSAGVNPTNVEKATELIIEEIRRIVTEPVSQEDLDDNLSYFTGRLPLQLETNEGIAGTIHSIESYGLGLDYLLNYRDALYKLTVDDLLHAAQNYLNPDALVISAAGPNHNTL